MKPLNTEKLLALVRIIDEEWTDGLVQNGEVMSNARLGKDAAARVTQTLDADHPAYSSAMLAWSCCAAILKAEEGEDLRQKGISGLWERHKPDLVAIIKFYANAQKEAPRAD